jgi:hypothetical protein
VGTSASPLGSVGDGEVGDGEVGVCGELVAVSGGGEGEGSGELVVLGGGLVVQPIRIVKIAAKTAAREANDLCIGTSGGVRLTIGGLDHGPQ